MDIFLVQNMLLESFSAHIARREKDSKKAGHNSGCLEIFPY